MFVVTCYDIANSRRRVRISKVLLSFGERVQESVYEAHVDAVQWKRMYSRVEALIKGEDRVCYYRLCANCQTKTLVTEGHPQALAPVPCIVVTGSRRAEARPTRRRIVAPTRRVPSSDVGMAEEEG